IEHPKEVLSLDQTINVVVLDFDDEKKRIALGLKQLSEHPWESLDTALEIGSKVKGKVVTVADYGAFLEIIPGVEGLIHVSEMSWSQNLRSPQEFLKVGDEVEAQILTLDREDRKMSLGIKQLTPDPWKNITERYPIGSKQSAVVKNMTNFGVLEGLIHVSEMSWSQNLRSPQEFLKVGDEVEAQILTLDREDRKMSLGIKQLTPDPWKNITERYPIGSKQSAVVKNMTNFGVFVEL